MATRALWIVLLVLALAGFSQAVLAKCAPAQDKLSALRWTSRILLVQCPSELCLAQWQQRVADMGSWLSERKLVVYVNTPSQWRQLVPSGDKAAPSATAAEDNVANGPCPATVSLYGLDGGKKATYTHAEFRWEVLDQRIAMMPMRQRELKTQGASSTPPNRKQN